MRSSTSSSQVFLLPLSVFALFFASGPLLQLEGLRLMPGDFGDARLNNYFLENIYLWVSGAGNSLWHLSFFWPFPYVGGFSDNLFGSSPPYLAARAFGAEPDTAFQTWFLFAYAVNFGACYYALRTLNLSVLAAACGAAIFTFALPVSSRAGHAQLHYRFGVPLALTMLVFALERKSWSYFLWSAFWLVWQFYCSIYIGVFAAVMMSVMIFVWVVGVVIRKSLHRTTTDFADRFKCALSCITSWNRIHAVQVAVLAALAGLLALLFFPYFVVSQSYGFQRSMDEIASMLPRACSYLLCDTSRIWASDSELFASLPMRHEHQMFFGLSVLALSTYGFVTNLRRGPDLICLLLVAGLFGVGLLTISISGWSLWYIAAQLPLVSAIRAVTRIDLVMLFPLAFLAALGIESLSQFRGRKGALTITLLLALVVVELNAVSPIRSPKEDWRQRLEVKQDLVPADLDKSTVLFFSQNAGLWFEDELDAMWVALRLGRPTLNGYTGNVPAGCTWEFGNNLTEAERRVRAYVKFAGATGGEEDVTELVARIMPVGFPQRNNISAIAVKEDQAD